MISNAAVMVPIGDDPDDMVGPYIQHTAQVDPGNSGGPLLVQDKGAPAGYAVAGINTLSFRRRQAANYSLPVKTALDFITGTLSGKETRAEDINKRIQAFISGMDANRAVYSHIAKYLSNECIAMNTEFALAEVMDKAPKTVLEEIVLSFIYDPITGMGQAVAWTIENSLRSKTGPIRADLAEVRPSGNNAYTVTISLQDKMVESAWIKEYGIWRIGTFGDIAAGDRSLITEKENKRLMNESLKTDMAFAVYTGFEYIIGQGPAALASLWWKSKFVLWDINFHFAGVDFIQAATGIGFYYPIRINTAAISPIASASAGFRKKEEQETSDGRLDVGLSFGWSIQGGIMVTTAGIPGLFGQLSYQYNNYYLGGTDVIEKGRHAVFIAVGYGF
jgi:serine protease Do